jgi:ketosteroid isomerase-like protein
MGAAVSQSLVLGFYQALARRDLTALLEFLDDDVEWKFLGPVEIFPFCGSRRGKAAVIDHFTLLMPVLFSIRRIEPDDLVIDGERAATFSKLTAVERGTGRILTFHCAHFVTFRDGKVVSMQAIADTFGLIDQLSCVRIEDGAIPATDLPNDMVPV